MFWRWRQCEGLHSYIVAKNKTDDICRLPCLVVLSGERGIRTPGASQLNGFQDRRNRPLCHLSGHKSTLFFLICKLF